MALRCLQGHGAATRQGGGADSLVEVGLRLLALDRGGEGVDGFIRAEHSGIPHGIVSLGREAEAPSPPAPSSTPRVLPPHLKHHHAKAWQHRQLALLPQNS